MASLISSNMFKLYASRLAILLLAPGHVIELSSFYKNNMGAIGTLTLLPHVRASGNTKHHLHIFIHKNPWLKS